MYRVLHVPPYESTSPPFTESRVIYVGAYQTCSLIRLQRASAVESGAGDRIPPPCKRTPIRSCTLCAPHSLFLSPTSYSYIRVFSRAEGDGLSPQGAEPIISPRMSGSRHLVPVSAEHGMRRTVMRRTGRD